MWPQWQDMRRLALTLWPEWAWAIAHFGKDVENRKWKRDSMVGEWIAIHAGKFIGGEPGDDALLDGLNDLRYMAEHVDDERGGCSPGGGLPVYSDLIPRIATSAIVAVGKVSGFLHGPAKGWYIGEPAYGWQLERLITLPTPVPCKGAQGLWEVPPEVLVQVRYQVDRAQLHRAT